MENTRNPTWAQIAGTRLWGRALAVDSSVETPRWRGSGAEARWCVARATPADLQPKRHAQLRLVERNSGAPGRTSHTATPRRCLYVLCGNRAARPLRAGRPNTGFSLRRRPGRPAGLPTRSPTSGLLNSAGSSRPTSARFTGRCLVDRRLMAGRSDQADRYLGHAPMWHPSLTAGFGGACRRLACRLRATDKAALCAPVLPPAEMV